MTKQTRNDHRPDRRRGRPMHGAVGVGALVFLVALATAPPSAAADGTGLWEPATAADGQRFEALLRQIEAELAPGSGAAPTPTAAPSTLAGQAAVRRQRAARAEGLLRAALALRPDDFRLTLALADVQAVLGAHQEALRSNRRALRLTDVPGRQAQAWLHLAAVHATLGQYTDAAAAYDRRLALAPADGALYANAAELWMAAGRLPEAEARYREAIRADGDAPDRRLREHSLALSYYGLGVALDRDGEALAAEEAITHALALDPGLGLLHLGEQRDGDVSFVPDGDVHYYLGLASRVAGHAADAHDGFQSFLKALPGSPYAAMARAHLATLERERRRRQSPAAWHVVTTATVQTQGPIPAPLIDASWRSRPGLLDTCLPRLPASTTQQPIRLALDLDFGPRGAVTRATVRAPADLDADFVACVQDAVKATLVVPAPAHGRPTQARVEVLLAQ